MATGGNYALSINQKFALANIAASQTGEVIVTGVANRKIRVLALACVTGATATTITFNSNSTAISCLFANGVNGGEILPLNLAGWFETSVGESLTGTTGSGATTGVQVVYIEV